MARALGIPARVIIGFSPGTVQSQADGAEVIVVRRRNAHAWVELFMSGQGWIRFDPDPASRREQPRHHRAPSALTRSPIFPSPRTPPRL